VSVYLTYALSGVLPYEDQGEQARQGSLYKQLASIYTSYSLSQRVTKSTLLTYTLYSQRLSHQPTC
jgi:hypothetical protein